MNVGELFKIFLNEYQSETPELDLQLLLAHVTGETRTWLFAHLDTPLTPPQIESAQNAFARLMTGEPLPYILGHWEFYGLDLDITPHVLIPRPETELLVEKAVKWLNNRPEARSVADVGTGSGAIAIAVAMHVPDVRILATDISHHALKVAKRNAQKFHVHHCIDFLECDLLPSHPAYGSPPQLGEGLGMKAFDLICANLPYIPTQTLHGLPIFEREPTHALDGGADGLDLVRRLLKLAPDWLAPGGMMLLEIEATQGTQALSLAYDSFDNVTIHLHQDMAGHDRLLEIMLP
jgi:release factor glutamine methyltransferase